MNESEFESISTILSEISITSGSNRKLELLQENQNNDNLKVFFRLAYDPYIKFNVVKFSKDCLIDGSLELNTFDDFLGVLDKLVNREVTGHAAVDLCSLIYKTLPSPFRHFFGGILDKDLRIGVGISKINEVWPGWIPQFRLGLCERYKKFRDNHFQNVY